jgi:hypothetical protein
MWFFFLFSYHPTHSLLSSIFAFLGLSLASNQAVCHRHAPTATSMSKAWGAQRLPTHQLPANNAPPKGLPFDGYTKVKKLLWLITRKAFYSTKKAIRYRCSFISASGALLEQAKAWSEAGGQAWNNQLIVVLVPCHVGFEHRLNASERDLLWV